MAFVTGTVAPDFTLPGTDGKTYGLAEYADRPVMVVVFTCNHCPYAQAWEDRLLKVGSKYGPRGVGMVLISANDPEKYPEDNFEAMQQRAKERDYPIPYLFDSTQVVARAYGAQRTPEVFVFDASRELRYHGLVDDSDDPAHVHTNYLRDAIEALLSGQPVAVTETQPEGCTIKWKA